MAIQNPCEDRRVEEQPSGDIECGPGRIRNADGVCVDINLSRNIPPIPPLPGQDPFAVEVDIQQPPSPPSPPLPNADDARDLVREGILSEIDYLSATRELTTIDESNFYRVDANIDLESTGMNHSSIWLRQKSLDQDLVNEVDRFRLALLNFWNFNGEYENITVRPVGDPRENNNSIQNVTPQGEGSSLSAYVLLTIKSQPEFGNIALAYWSNPVDVNNYTLMENVPFQFYKPAIDRARRQFPNETKVSHIMDMYMEGANSSAWLLQNRQQFWQQNPDKFSLLVGGNIEYGKMFYDFTFDAPAAFFEKEMDNIILSPFDSADIEVVLQNQDLHQDIDSELEIPSVYQYYQSKQITNRINNDQILEENLPPGLVDFNQRSIDNYEEFTNENEFQTKEVLKFPSDKVELLEEINKSIRGSLNNYAVISINTKQGGPINAALQRNKMDIMVLQTLQSNADQVWERIFFNQKRKQKLFTKVLDDQFIAPDDQGVVNTTVNDKAVQNIQETIYNYVDKIISANQNERRQQVFWPRDLEEFPLYYTGWENDFRTQLEELIRSQIFLDQMNQHIETAKLERSYADLLYGRKAYSEVIGYKVEKYRVDRPLGIFGPESETKVQEFLFMDNDNVERLEFLDTQIIPDKKYKYKIFTINFVIGTQYEYNEQASSYSWLEADQETVRDNERDGRLALNVLSGRCISLIYAPFFEKVVSTADKPPITPQVSFLPYQGVDNKYAILLQSGYGENLEKPIVVLREDKVTIQETYRTQARRPGTEILYRSDSLPHRFEMIRIEEEPETYRDFDSPSAEIVSKEATGQTAFIMVDVEPNKYYYYIFRTIDAGGISNPTEVFRVRMVSYQNGIFMEMEPYEMYKKPEDFSVSFARVLKITPNIEQKMINFDNVFQQLEQQQVNQESIVRRLRDELGLNALADTREFQRTAPSVEDIRLGNKPVEESVWDKRFKLRCTSRTTGKKIDINFTFSQTKTKIDRD